MGLRQPTLAAPMMDQRARTRDFDGLVEQLNAPCASQRRWAARDITHYHLKAVAPLLATLSEERSSTVQEALLVSLERLESTATADGLVALLHTRDTALRQRIVDTLQSMPRHVAPHIPPLLSHSDADIRIVALDIIRGISHPNITTWLEQTLINETDYSVMTHALDRLYTMGGLGLTQPLLDVKQRFTSCDYIHDVIDRTLSRIEACQ